MFTACLFLGAVCLVGGVLLGYRAGYSAGFCDGEIHEGDPERFAPWPWS